MIEFSLVKRVALIVFFVVFSFTYLNAYEIKVIEENQGLKLIISDIEPKFLAKEKRLSFNTQGIYTSINPNSELSAEALLIPFALPQNINGNIRTNITSKKIIDLNANIKSISDYSVNITKYNKHNNFRVAFLYIQPFKQSGSKLEYINNIEISIDFDQTVGISESISSNYLRNYIINKRHFDYLDNQIHQSNSIVASGLNWYDKDKKYIELKTNLDEIYSISTDTIIKLYPELEGKQFKHIHLLNRNNEVFFGIQNKTDNITKNNSIIFIGSRPKGDTTWLNSYSKYESFYLYYDDTFESKIFKEFPVVNSTQEIDYVIYNKHFEQEKEYAVGYDYIQTRTCEGEYWLWKIIEPYFNNTFQYPLDLVPFDGIKDSIKLDIAFNSIRLNSTPGWFRGHHYRVDINNTKIEDKIVKDGKYYSLNYNISNKDFNSNNNTFYFRTTGVLDSSMVLATNDHIGLDYFNIQGKIIPELTKDVKDFRIEKLSENKSLKIRNIQGKKYIIDTLNKQFYFSENGSNEETINLENQKEYHLFGTNGSTINTPIHSIANRTDYSNPANKADVLIITHKNFLSSTDSLVKVSKKYNPENSYFVANVEDIYKEFNFGNKSPHAIRDFIQLTQSQWQKPSPKFIFLIGDANYDTRNVIEKSINFDFVPSYGWPYSDYWYTTTGDSANNSPEMKIGRLTVKSEAEVYNYIDKLKSFYETDLNPWQKTFFMISGGGPDEKERFQSYMQSLFSPILVKPEFCADSITLAGRDNNATGESDGQKIISIINKGIGFTTFLGHGSPTVFDTDGWNSHLLNNRDKYGYLLTISCNSSAFGEPNIISRNEEYVLEKNKGFISAGGSTFVTNVVLGVELQLYINRFLADTSLRIRNFAELINLAKYQLLAFEQDYLIREAYAYQFGVIGDPSLDLYPAKYAELYFLKDYINVTNKDNSTIIETDDYVNLKGTLFNNGYKINSGIRIFCIRTYNQKTDTTIIYNMPEICLNNNFSFRIPIKGMPGTHYIKLVVDPDNFYREDNKQNNVFSTQFDVYKLSLVGFDPLPYWNVKADKPEFRIINPLQFSGKLNYEFEIRDRSDSVLHIVKKSTEDEITIDSNFIDWKPKAILSPSQSLVFAGRYITETGYQSQWVEIPFYTLKIPILDSARLLIRSKEELLDLKSENLYLENNNLIYSYKIKYNQVPVRLESSLYDSINQISSALINVDGNDIIWTQSKDIRPRGFNIVHMNSENGEVKQKRTYDTFGDDSSSIKFLQYYRDSVDINDIVLFVICDRAFHVPMIRSSSDSPGSMDSLRYFLKSLGSTLADDIGYNSAYAFISSKNPKLTFFKEVHDSSGQKLISIDTSFTFYSEKGNITTAKIGPAKIWNNLNFIINYSSDSSTVDFELFGIDKATNLEKSLKTFKNQLHVDISDIDANKYNYIKLKINLYNNKFVSENKRSSISSINCNFIPANELAIYQHLTIIENDSLDRGDSVIYSTQVRNLSKRIYSDPNEITFRIGDISSKIDYHSHPLKSLKPDEIYSYTFQRYTDKYLPSVNNISVKVNDSSKVGEFFTYNNEANLNLFIFNDSLKPYLDVYCDTVLVQNYDFVQIKPRIKVKIYDNSKMPIDDIKNWAYRLNSKWKSLKSVNYTSFGRNTKLKGEFEFESDSFEIGENLYSFYMLDGNGLRDTLNLRLNVSLNGKVENLVNFPNPFSEITYFNFTYKAPILYGTARIEIYDYNGREINKLNYPIRIGRNEMFWDGKDFYGRELPIGFYLYKILITNSEEIFVEPIFGKFMILR